MQHTAGSGVAREVAAPDRPSANWLDIGRLTLSGVGYGIAGAVRRAAGRKRHTDWSLSQELWIAAARGAWSLLPRVGVVRWRNATEAVSPLRADGLLPRFILDEVDGCAVRGAWLEPPAAGPQAVLYFHGGGYVFGSLRSHGDLIGAIARAAAAPTFVVDYRLGPEHPAPAAAQDAVAAFHYMLRQGIAPGRIVLAGDSAGGTMVLNTLVALRDGGVPLPAGAVAICPWVDLSCSGASFEENAALDFVGKEHCLLAAAAYLNGIDPRRSDVSPLFAPLAGLPPLLVQAGGAEVLVDQIRAFAARAQEAGVDVRLAEYAGMVHVWHMMRHLTPDAQRAIDEIGVFVRQRTAGVEAAAAPPR